MYLPLALPPGVWANGTDYQTKGRYRTQNLTRWSAGAPGSTLQPIGAWRAKTASTVTGKARAILTWKTNSSLTYAAIGTHSHLYAMNRAGTVYDITPVGFASGRADAVAGGGYGTSSYGSASYGAPRPDTTLVQDASVWDLDTWGEDLVGCMADDGVIYEWGLNTGTPAAAVSGAPTAIGILVTEEGFLFALGADSDFRTIAWSDQQDNTTWTPDPTNQARNFPLQTFGKIICGRRATGAVLIFTEVDVWRGSYVGPPLVYGFERLASECGIVSKGAALNAGGNCYWMGAANFWIYNGYVEPLPCDVNDRVFQDFNRTQASKVTGFHNSEFGEVWWFYPSAASVENDRYVFFDYRHNHWGVGELSRLSITGRGVFLYPLAVDSSGNIWEHEVSSGGTFSGTQPYARGGPIELGNGDKVFMARELVPDERTAGDATVTFYAKFWPNGDEETIGPYAAANPIDVRFTARQVEVEYMFSATPTSSQIGVPRLEVVPRGSR